jgi:hypothetical protein
MNSVIEEHSMLLMQQLSIAPTSDTIAPFLTPRLPSSAVTVSMTSQPDDRQVPLIADQPEGDGVGVLGAA